MEFNPRQTDIYNQFFNTLIPDLQVLKQQTMSFNRSNMISETDVYAVLIHMPIIQRSEQEAHRVQIVPAESRLLKDTYHDDDPYDQFVETIFPDLKIFKEHRISETDGYDVLHMSHTTAQNASESKEAPFFQITPEEASFLQETYHQEAHDQIPLEKLGEISKIYQKSVGKKVSPAIAAEVVRMKRQQAQKAMIADVVNIQPKKRKRNRNIQKNY